MGKMKKLLEILSSPGQRITMETLLKCEVVLEKLDIKVVVSNYLESEITDHTQSEKIFFPIATRNSAKRATSIDRSDQRSFTESES